MQRHPTICCRYVALIPETCMLCHSVTACDAPTRTCWQRASRVSMRGARAAAAMPAPASATAVAVPVTTIARTSLRTRGRRCWRCCLLAMLTPAPLLGPAGSGCCCLWCGGVASTSAACLLLLLLLHAGDGWCSSGAACMCMCRWRWRPPAWSSAAAAFASNWWEASKSTPVEAAMDKCTGQRHL